MMTLLVGLAGCALDARTGRALVDALADGPVRDYAGLQADAVAQASLVLRTQVVPEGGAMPELAAAQQSWRRARAAYERGVAVFLVVAADLDFALDGPLDDGLAQTGLRQLETKLFAPTPAAPAELDRLTAALATSAAALHVAVPDHGRALSGAALLGSLSGAAALLSTKFDGSASPYAGAGLLAIEHDLIGMQEMYGILAPPVAATDAELDQRIAFLLRDLLEKVRSYSSTDAIADKVSLLRECAALSQALRQVGTVLGLSVTQIDLS